MNIKSSAVKGVAWNSIGKIGTGVVNFIIMIFLARLLSPYDFGLIALLIVFTTVSEVFVDSGFSQAVIRDNNASDHDLTSVFYTNLIIAAIIYLFLFISSPYIADFYETPELKWLSRVVFLTVVFNSLSIIQDANFARQVNFRPHAISTLISMSIAGIISIVMATKGFGVWALASNLIIYSFLKSFLLWIQSDWRPKGWIVFKSIKKYFMFGGNLLVIGITDRIVSNLESLLIGKVYAKSELGFFSKARELNSYIIQTSTSVVKQVSYPILSKVQDDKIKLKSYYSKLVGITMLMTMPITAFIVVSADNFLFVIFGEKWLPATPYLILWTVCGLFVALYSIFTNIFLVRGESRLYMKISLFRQIARISIIIGLLKTSVFYLLVGIVIVTIFSGVVYMWQGGKLINYGLRNVFMDLVKIIVASCCSGLAVLLINYINIDNGVIKLLLQLLTMTFSYGAIIHLLKDRHYNEMKKLVFSFVMKK
jgi:O-antigen/teichoic acid export membrane protein